MEQYIRTLNGKTFFMKEVPGREGTVVAVHGLTGSHKQFMHYEDGLAGNYRFISYDIAGRGNSSKSQHDTSIYTHADDLADLITTLNIENPILLGYSMGAYICGLAALNLAHITPKSLILLDGAGETDGTAREIVLPSLNRMKKSYSDPDSYVKAMKELYGRLNIEWNERLADFVRYELKKEGNGWKHKSDARSIEQDFESFYTFDPSILENRITCPVLLIIATGSLGGNRSLFTEQSYMSLKRSLPQMHITYTAQNHYEIVLNRQPDIIRKMINFLTAQGR